MTKGFYNLTSGILSQTRRLDVVGNNMTNVTTPGYKKETYTDTTFEEVLISRVGNSDKSDSEVIGSQSYMLASDELYYDLTESGLDITGLNLDFAIMGEGFFGIQTQNGVQYTRGGSFQLDEEGYLYAPTYGRVLGTNGQPIQLNSDIIDADMQGRLFDSETGNLIGQIGLFTFEDESLLAKTELGLFDVGGQVATPAQTQQVMWKAVENSNVDLASEMSNMLTAQRALQSAAQVLKMYDEVLTKSVNDIARI